MQTCYVCQHEWFRKCHSHGSYGWEQGYDVYVYNRDRQNVAGGRQGQFTVNGNAPEICLERE